MRKIPNNELGRPTPEQFALAEKIPVTVVLDNIRSANNVGSFFRTCDAFAVRKLLLCGITACPPNRDLHKTALGAEDTVRWEHFETTTTALESLRGKEVRIIAVEQVEGAVMLGDMTIERDAEYALVFGNEVNGVSEQAISLCDGALEIPQAGTKHSLNVAVSGGAVLWHFFNSLYSTN